jgi:hypothetical protein
VARKMAMAFYMKEMAVGMKAVGVITNLMV